MQFVEVQCNVKTPMLLPLEYRHHVWTGHFFLWEITLIGAIHVVKVTSATAYELSQNIGEGRLLPTRGAGVQVRVILRFGKNIRYSLLYFT